MPIVILYLTTGDVVIAEYLNEEGSSYTQVMRPLRMIISDKGIMLQMWFPYDMDKPVKINNDLVVACSEAAPPLAAEYKSKFSDLIVPDKPGLIVP